MTKESKAVLISGGAQGIGRCLARHFLKKGHRVYILDVNEEELAYTTKTHLKSYGSNVTSSVCNLRDISQIREHVAKAADFFGGRIDVLLHNAGIASPQWKDGKTMEDLATMDEWIAYVETNTTAPFAVSQACIPYMKVPEKKSGGKQDQVAGPCIVFICSFRAHMSDPNQEGYASTKAAQLGLTHSMAITCQQWGIRVNSVAPGRIKVTHECKKGDEEGTQWEISEDDARRHATNRAGMPEDIAEAAEYLVGAGFVTAQEIVVDGGVSMTKNNN